MVSGDQVFSHLHNILETVFACINFNFPGLMLFHQDLDSRNIPKVTQGKTYDYYFRSQKVSGKQSSYSVILLYRYTSRLSLKLP